MNPVKIGAMIKAVFIDMDDTLIVNQVLYSLAEAKLVGYLAAHGIPTEKSEEVFKKHDSALLPTLGYSRERMPSAFEQTLKELIPTADAQMVNTVRDFAEAIFTTVARPKPGTAEALELLTAHYPVYLVTQGDHGVQYNRIANLPFKGHFTETHVIEKKSPEVFRELLDRHDLKPEEVVMIGDSLRSDIIPSTQIGMSAIWIEAHNSHHEFAPDVPKGGHKYASLMEAAIQLITHGTPVRELSLPAPKRKKGFNTAAAQKKAPRKKPAPKTPRR